MNIVINEIKKIFNPKMVFLLIIINIIMYFLFIEFNIKYFPNGRPEGDIYRVMVQMKKDYGTNMDKNEFEDFKIKYNEKVKEADKYIKEHKQFTELGINSYDEFIKAEDKCYKVKDIEIENKNEKLGKQGYQKTSGNINEDKKFKIKFEKLFNNIMFKKGADLFWEIPERENMIERYQTKEKRFDHWYDSTKKQKIRIKEISNNKSDTSVFNRIIFTNYNNLIFYVSLTILFSVIFMISPIYLRDNKNNVNFLQYTSKRGRNLFKSKAAAGIIASLVITTIQLICFFILYSHNNVGMFFNSNINSFLNSPVSWYEITFIQYIVITVSAIYILVLSVSIMSMLISSVVHSYIALVGVQIPIVLLSFKLVLRHVVTGIVDIRFTQGIIPLCYVTMIAVLILLIIIRWRKEKVVDIF